MAASGMKRLIKNPWLKGGLGFMCGAALTGISYSFKEKLEVPSQPISRFLQKHRVLAAEGFTNSVLETKSKSLTACWDRNWDK